MISNIIISKNMNYLIFIGLALLEQILMVIITNNIVNIQNNKYINIQYASFKFNDKEERKCGLNILLEIFFPIIYIIIISGVFYNIGKEELVKDIYVVTIFYYIISWLNIILVLGRKELHDWKSEFITSVIGIILNIFIYNVFIIKTTQIFISIDTLRDSVYG